MAASKNEPNGTRSHALAAPILGLSLAAAAFGMGANENALAVEANESPTPVVSVEGWTRGVLLPDAVAQQDAASDQQAAVEHHAALNADRVHRIARTVAIFSAVELIGRMLHDRADTLQKRRDGAQYNVDFFSKAKERVENAAEVMSSPGVKQACAPANLTGETRVLLTEIENSLKSAREVAEEGARIAAEWQRSAKEERFIPWKLRRSESSADAAEEKVSPMTALPPLRAKFTQLCEHVSECIEKLHPNGEGS